MIDSRHRLRTAALRGLADSLYRLAGIAPPAKPARNLSAVLQSFHNDDALVLQFDTDRGRLNLRIDRHDAEQVAAALFHYLKPFQRQTEDGKPQDLPGNPSSGSIRPSETS